MATSPHLAAAGVKRVGKSDGEQRAHKRQIDLLNEDAKRLCSVDISAPFKSLHDAMERLLPYHLLGGLHPEAGDGEELAEHEIPELVISRSELWAQHCSQLVLGTTRIVDTARTKVDTLEHRLAAKRAGPSQVQEEEKRGAGGWSSAAAPSAADATTAAPAGIERLPEEQLLVHRILLNDAREALERERRRPAGYETPDEDEVMEAGTPMAADAAVAASMLSPLGQSGAAGVTPSGAAALGDALAGLQEPATAAALQSEGGAASETAEEEGEESEEESAKGDSEEDEEDEEGDEDEEEDEDGDEDGEEDGDGEAGGSEGAEGYEGADGEEGLEGLELEVGEGEEDGDGEEDAEMAYGDDDGEDGVGGEDGAEEEAAADGDGEEAYTAADEGVEEDVSLSEEEADEG